MTSFCFPAELATLQNARYGRRLTRARFMALHRKARRDFCPSAYPRRFHGLKPVREILAPLKSEQGALRSLAARSLAWAGYERRGGRLEQARAAIAHARRERLESEART